MARIFVVRKEDEEDSKNVLSELECSLQAASVAAATIRVDNDAAEAAAIVVSGECRNQPT